MVAKHTRLVRGMPGVKDAVVDAVEELHLKSTAGSMMDPRQAANNLVGLAQASSLGQSPSFAHLPPLALLLTLV